VIPAVLPLVLFCYGWWSWVRGHDSRSHNKLATKCASRTVKMFITLSSASSHLEVSPGVWNRTSWHIVSLHLSGHTDCPVASGH